MLTHSFEDLAQSFRVLVESHFRCNQLLTVDRPEAVGTLETAINAQLNSFHSLYDSMGQNLGNPVNWYSTSQLCVILAIRNARHHNKANKIRSIYNYHVQTCNKPTDKKNYLYVNFPADPTDGDAAFFDVPLSWGDLDNFISLPHHESKLKSETKKLVRAYMNADAFEDVAVKKGISKEYIFFNFVPLTLNAGIVLQPYIKDHVALNSIESESFLGLFGSSYAALTRQHEYKILELSLPA